MQELDPERIFIENVLQQTLKSLLLTLETYSEEASPTLHIVSGAPGSGKSTLCQRLLDENCNVVYLCGDIVKRKFQEKLKHASVPSGLSLPVLEKYNDAVYIHRLTSPITWHLFDKAIKLRKSVLLEMIGTDPVSDAHSIIDAIKSGYKSHVYHVACTQNRAITCAIDRFFSSGSEDSGRYISLTNISNKHETILTTYRDTIANLHGYNCLTYLYDNSEWAMEEVFRADLLIDKTEPNISRFLSLEKESGLWYQGENHSADLIAFAFDDDGDLCVAAASRLKSPFIGMFGLPGGFVYTKAKRGTQYLLNMETPLEAALREFGEKTLFRLAPTTTLIPIGVYKGKNRDPRDSIEAAVVSNAFAIHFDQIFPLTPGSDVQHAKWIKVRDIKSGKVPLAFDHATIVFDAISKLRLQFTKGLNEKCKIRRRGAGI